MWGSKCKVESTLGDYISEKSAFFTSAVTGAPQAAAPANQNNPIDLQIFTNCRQEDGRGKGSE